MRKTTAGLIMLLLLSGRAVATDIPTITCPTDPPRVRRLQLQERWRIDPEDTDAPLLGVIGTRSIVANDGRVYLLDTQLAHVLVYDDDGQYLDTILREGDGPGEVRQPNALFLCADGTLAVQHGYPSKLEFVAVDGTPLGRWRLQANAWLRNAEETPEGWFGVYTANRRSDDDPSKLELVLHVALHDADGERTVEFHRAARLLGLAEHDHSDEADDYDPWAGAVYVAGGQVVTAGVRDAYRLEWHDRTGVITRLVTREFPVHRRTKDEVTEQKYGTYSIVDGHVTFPDRRVCDDDPVIVGLDPLPDGRLRVRTSFFAKELPAGMACRYEVHASTGELLERVEIHDPTGAYDPDYDGIALLDDGRAMILHNLSSASRAAYWASRPAEVREKLPPPPDEREDVAFVPIMCDLVPYEEGGHG